MSCHQIAEYIYSISIGIKTFGSVAKFKTGINSKKSELQRRRI
jgi:hypothetical protein